MSKLKKIALLCFVLFSVMFMLCACDWSNNNATIFAIDVQQSTGGYISPDKQLAEPGETVTLTVRTDSGYRLSLLAYNSIVIDGNSFEMPNRNVTITARFDTIYNVRVLNSTGGTITVDKRQAVAGETVSVSVQTQQHYVLEALLVNGGEIDGNSFTMQNDNVIVSARYRYLVHNVDVNQTTGGYVTIDKSLAAKNEVVTVTTIVDAGYKLSFLTYNSVLMEGNTFAMPDRDVVVQAKFVRVYDVVVRSNNEVELQGQGKYAEGEEVELATEEIDGYRFMGWKFGDSIVADSLTYTFTLTLDNHGTYTAVYEKIYLVTITNSTGGTITSNKAEAIEGEMVTLTVEEDDGFELDKLFVNGVEIDGKTFEMPDENVEITATYVEL